MSDREWEKLFDLIEKAVNLDGMSANEKAALVRMEAESRECTGDLEEFVAMLTY